MSAASAAARDILDTFWGLGLPVAYVAFRGLFVPRAFEHSDDPPLSVLDETVPERSDTVRGGTLVFAAVAVMSLLFFLNVAGSNIVLVIRERPAWGVLTCILGLGLIAVIVAVEWLYQQNNRYTDLLSDADQKASALRASHYGSMAKAARTGMIVWVFGLGIAVVWVWRISRGA